MVALISGDMWLYFLGLSWEHREAKIVDEISARHFYPEIVTIIDMNKFRKLIVDVYKPR